MNGTHQHDLDDVALYALGTLPAADAARVRELIAACADCRAEYDALAFAPVVLARSGGSGEPSALLKARIMRDVRAEARPQQQAQATQPRALQPSYPAYIFAAACLAIAVISVLANMSLYSKYRASVAYVSQLESKNGALSRDLSASQAQVAEVLSVHAHHFPVKGGVVVRVHDHLYLALHDLPAPKEGHVYQAWTQAKGEKAMSPSVTFKPDAAGEAVIPLPVDAEAIDAVAVSVEPDGGSKAPTTKPILVTTVD